MMFALKRASAYAKEGTVQLCLHEEPAAYCFEVRAEDEGPGIPNLAEIMAGRYKSRSGLGLGLLGTKRLADSFDVETGRGGTTVSVEVIL